MNVRWQHAETTDSPAEEVRILEQSRHNPAAFAPLYSRYFPRIYGYCLRRLNSSGAAEDATSLVFTRALTGLQHYRGGSVAAWLFQIAHNTVANELRAQRPALSLESTAVAFSREAPSIEEEALTHLIVAEEYQRLAALLSALPNEERELLTLKVVGRLSAKEIGIVVGKREGAVRVALHRLIQRLRTRYDESVEEQQ
ncbi:MAG: RNA polymerase sigma factor [Thermomicrobiales bacterium]